MINIGDELEGGVVEKIVTIEEHFLDFIYNIRFLHKQTTQEAIIRAVKTLIESDPSDKVYTVKLSIPGRPKSIPKYQLDDFPVCTRFSISDYTLRKWHTNN